MLRNPCIGAIVFYVADIRRTESFYRETMGLNTRLIGADASEGHSDESFVMADVGDVTLIFFQGTKKPGASPIVVFTLSDGGIDDLVEQLAARGVQIVTPVSEAPGGWSSDFLDPDGHVLSIYQVGKVPRTLEQK